jgi:hypothetical protein
MPNPRANRPLTLDQVTADLKSLSQPAQALFDMMAGGLRGSAVGTFGAPGDIETLGRMGLNAAGGSFNPAMPSRSGRAFQPVSEEPYFPSSEELAKRFAPTIPNGDPVRRKSAEPFEEVGQFAPLPLSGKALKVLPYALGRGTGMATKEAARAINDAMVYQTGPLSQGPLSMLAPKGAVSHVVKPKGGNWLSGSVEQAVKPLKRKVATENIDQYTPEQAARLEASGRLEVNDALNNWVDRNLTNYIKKEMATPEDPVRRLAEEGVTHFPVAEDPRYWARRGELTRGEMGGTQMAQSDLAKQWENRTDHMINRETAQEHRDMMHLAPGMYSENDAWINKLPPETSLYSTHGVTFNTSDLGFDHIVDVLKEDLATGRIRPEQLNKVSMEQAVRRTAEYDQELAAKMNAARAAKREGLPVQKEYPEGYRWVELNRPGSFASESEAMGHSVRGYEPPRGHPDWTEGSGDSGSSGYGHGGWEAIKSGKAKVYSLVDPKGEPHVTVEVGEHNPNREFLYAKQNLPELYAKYSADRNKYSNSWPDFLRAEAPELLEAKERKITQIKGKQNAAPKEEYLPFVQDFVRGGNWSQVGDLHNTGLRDIQNTSLDKYLKNKGVDAQRYLPEDEYLKYEDDFLMDRLYPNDPLPTDGMKRGGSVHISDNPDTMMMELGDKHMKDGGSEDDTKAFIGYPNLAKQARYSRAVAPERGDVNLLKDPQTYAFAMGMLGEAPDELGFTVLDSDEQKQKIKAAGEKGFVTGAVSQLGPLAQLGKKAGKKILSLAGEGINERMLSGRSLTPFVDTPAPVMFAVPPEKELTLPSKLPRAKPRGKEELRPLAQEMAEATQGGFYRPEPSKSVNPAGKSFDQWKTEQGLVHDIRPTAKHQAIPRADIEKQKGMVKMGISGDTTVAEQVLHEAGPYALDIPSPQHGGALYGLGGEGAWASNNPIAANVQKRVNEISQAYDDAPVLGQYMQMGKLGSDFALHFADANLRAINLKKMSKDQIEMVNELIRKGSPKSGPRDSFPGIQDKDSAYLHFAVDPELRKHFNAIMQKPTYTEPLGLPDGRIIHHSITEPALRDLPVTTTGFSQMELHPGYDPEKLLLSEHPTYSHVIPHKPNTGLTRTQYHTPAQVEFPDVHEYLTKSGPRIYNTQDMTRMYQTSTPRQIIDQQHIDEIKMFEDLMKQYGGKKKGGAIKAKKDGQKFKPGKKPDQILKHGQAMPRGKDPEVDISQMMPMMAGGGSINADDLILEERPL